MSTNTNTNTDLDFELAKIAPYIIKAAQTNRLYAELQAVMELMQAAEVMHGRQIALAEAACGCTLDVAAELLWRADCLSCEAQEMSDEAGRRLEAFRAEWTAARRLKLC